MDEILQRLPQVKADTALSRTEIYKRISTGEFPAPIALGLRAVAWKRSDVQAWIASRVAKASTKESQQ
jgi:prophage regulatory protein